MADFVPAAIATTPINIGHVSTIGGNTIIIYDGFFAGRHNPPSTVDNIVT